jgi:hypothetical protein
VKTVLQEIRLISPFLGSGKPDENGLRRILLNNVKKNEVKLFLTSFLNNFKKLTNVTIDENFQIYPGLILSDKTVPMFFERKEIDIDRKGYQLFEILPVGFTGYLKIQYNPEVWDETYLLNGIKTIANHNGITQFGAKQGYGKFIFTNEKSH